jgi:hypothetical protein
MLYQAPQQTDQGLQYLTAQANEFINQVQLLSNHFNELSKIGTVIKRDYVENPNGFGGYQYRTFLGKRLLDGVKHSLYTLLTTEQHEALFGKATNFNAGAFLMSGHLAPIKKAIDESANEAELIAAIEKFAVFLDNYANAYVSLVKDAPLIYENFLKLSQPYSKLIESVAKEHCNVDFGGQVGIAPLFMQHPLRVQSMLESLAKYAAKSNYQRVQDIGDFNHALEQVKVTTKEAFQSKM